MVTNLIPPIEKSSPQIQNIFAPHKKVWYVIYCVTIRTFWCFFYFHIEFSFLLQLIILCIILNCRDCIFVSRNDWYDRWKIFGHSSSEIWTVAVAFHLVMPVSFLYLYLINCLYSVFVSISQRGTILPPRLTKGSLIFVLTGLFLISCRHSIGRLCLIWREFKKLQLISYFSLI